MSAVALQSTVTPLPAMDRSVVYLVAGAYHQVKIGYTTDLAGRVSALSSGVGFRVHVLRVVDGGRATERWFHKRFAAHRTHGEWFKFHPDMLSVIPPDEIIPRQKVTIRRDVHLTATERLRDAKRLGHEIGLSDHQILTTFVSTLTNEESREFMDLIASRRLAHADALEAEGISKAA